MDDMALYDEFGNYIGPDLPAMENQEGSDVMSVEEEEPEHAIPQSRAIIPQQGVVVLNEDKQYYPEAEEVYGQGVETMVQEEDAQPITEPMISIIKSKEFDLQEQRIDCTFEFDFLAALMGNPELVRNVALVGHLHSGKTTLMDTFVQQTHLKQWSLSKDYRYTDTRIDEQERQISLKSTPMSLVLPDSRDKHYLINLFDTPGHVNFSDEVCASLRACDGMLLVVDVVEGVMLNTERMIRYAVHEDIAITVILNKVDRLCVELKLPPADAYLKLKHTLEEINGIIVQAAPHKEHLKLSPLLGNVAFGSGYYHNVFTLKSYARMYAKQYNLEASVFEKLLWGDYYYNPLDRKFTKQAGRTYTKRTFVEFILEPIYKIIGMVVSKEREDLEPFLAQLGVFLKKSEYKIDTKPLLKLVMGRYFGNTSPVVDMLVAKVPNVKVGTALKVGRNYLGPRDEQFDTISKCDPKGPLVVNIVKLYNKPDCLSFDAFGRVLSGTIHRNQTVKVLGENYNTEDEEDMTIKVVKNLWVYQGRYRVEISKVPAGNWVLIEGIDQSITKSATITALDTKLEIMRPIKHNTLPTMKVAVEPLVPSELPKMLEGLRKINKSYPLLHTKVEESGEHILLGTGEVYLDCALHDLRKMYSEIEIKVSDPSVGFCETVIDTSSRMCYADAPNKKNRLTMTAQPLDKGLADEIERELITIDWDKSRLSKHMQESYDWDVLAARSLWAFGPDRHGPNVLLDDSLPNATNKQLLGQVRESVVQGFQWATREGPLCDEPIRNVKFKIIDARVADEPIHRGGGQIIPTARRTCYSSFLMATPRIMEPMLLAEIQCTADSLNAIYNVLVRRRGHVISETAKPGSPLYTVKAHIPTIDHFGFETDLRVHTQGQAFVLTVFDHWSLLPGDPLDKTIQLKPLEPSPPPHLAREFMVKTRRRKGLNEDVSILKYFDDVNLIEALKQDKEYQQFI